MIIILFIFYSFYFKPRLSLKFDRKLDENLQNKITTETEHSKSESYAEERYSNISNLLFCQVFHSGTIVFKTQDERKM